MPETNSLKSEWRSPSGWDTLSLPDVQYSPSEDVRRGGARRG